MQVKAQVYSVEVNEMNRGEDTKQWKIKLTNPHFCYTGQPPAEKNNFKRECGVDSTLYCTSVHV